MIDLEKGKNNPKGIKDKPSHFKYGNKDDVWLSRSKFDDYKKCKRCFYLINSKRLIPPGTPQFTMNSTTDKLLKKEFDLCREKQKSHKFLIKKKLEHIVPYKNDEIATNVYGDQILYSKTKHPYKKMDAWRTNYHGLQTRFKNTNIILYGSVDDIWLDTKNNSLIVVDYKSQANATQVSQENYFSGDYKDGYQRQLDFYNYLLKQQNLNLHVSEDAYLYVVNTRGQENEFDNKLLFESSLIHTKVKTDYLENEIEEMIEVFKSKDVPSSEKKCKNCAYARQRTIYNNL